MVMVCLGEEGGYSLFDSRWKVKFYFFNLSGYSEREPLFLAFLRLLLSSPIKTPSFN